MLEYVGRPKHTYNVIINDIVEQSVDIFPTDTCCQRNDMPRHDFSLQTGWVVIRSWTIWSRLDIIVKQ